MLIFHDDQIYQKEIMVKKKKEALEKKIWGHISFIATDKIIVE